MKLEQWLKENKMRKCDLADALGVKRYSISRYINGRQPKQPIMRKIKELTNGQVTADSFYE